MNCKLPSLFLKYSNVHIHLHTQNFLIIQTTKNICNAYLCTSKKNHKKPIYSHSTLKFTVKNKTTRCHYAHCTLFPTTSADSTTKRSHRLRESYQNSKLFAPVFYAHLERFHNAKKTQRLHDYSAVPFYRAAQNQERLENSSGSIVLQRHCWITRFWYVFTPHSTQVFAKKSLYTAKSSPLIILE